MRRRLRCPGPAPIPRGQCQRRRSEPNGPRGAIRAGGRWTFEFHYTLGAAYSYRMKPRVVVLTGANGGLGVAIAQAFLRESPDNLLWLGVHHRRERVEELIQENP